MLERAQAFSHTLLGDDMSQMEEILEASSAFKESNEGVFFPLVPKSHSRQQKSDQLFPTSHSIKV
jgi:hypothetical protein